MKAGTVSQVALVVVGCLLGALFAEAAFRLYLNHRYPVRFNPPDRDRNITAYHASHWEFDERFGYVYPPGRVLDYVSIIGDRVESCDQVKAINAFGNIGPVSGDWKSASLRVAVFGDSWTAFQQEGLTWPNFLHKALEQRLGRSVAVMNFGRDGYGLLQMFDLAAAKVEEWKPDLAIVAFISPDLVRGRFWRTVVGEGDAQRVLTTIDPVRVPREERAADTYLLFAPATYDWCKRMEGAAQPDATLAALIDKHRKLYAKAHTPSPSIWDLRHSYLFDRLWRGNAFWHLERRLRPAQQPQHSYASFAEDGRFVENVRRLRELGAAPVLFHLAMYPEMKAGREYLLDARERRLLDSLESSVGTRVLRTTDYVERPMAALERINLSAADYHPSLWGMEFYANVVATALLKEKLVPPPGARGR